jgi:thiol:disulfide interchange protein DsbC
MSSRSRAAHRVLLALAPALALPALSFAQCPTAEQTGKRIQETFKRPLDVKKVTPSALKGICEVQFQFQGRANVLYTDAAGDFFLTGHVIDAKSGKDLTEESLAVMNTFSPAEMQKVSSLAALTLGKGEKVVYFVTDPM